MEYRPNNLLALPFNIIPAKLSTGRAAQH